MMTYKDKEILDYVNNKIKLAKKNNINKYTLADCIENIINSLPDCYSPELISMLWKIQENILMDRI